MDEGGGGQSLKPTTKDWEMFTNILILSYFIYGFFHRLLTWLYYSGCGWGQMFPGLEVHFLTLQVASSPGSTVLDPSHVLKEVMVVAHNPNAGRHEDVFHNSKFTRTAGTWWIICMCFLPYIFQIVAFNNFCIYGIDDFFNRWVLAPITANISVNLLLLLLLSYFSGNICLFNLLVL